MKTRVSQGVQREGAQKQTALVARQQRVAAIKSAVAEGTYRIRPEDLAEKLLKTMEDR